jgi:predicted Zn-dependent protease
MRKSFLFLPFIILMLFAACAHQADLKQDPVSRPLSKRDLKEIEVGRMIDAQITDNYYLYEETRLSDYVNRIGTSLAQYSKRNNLPYSFSILYDQRIYATAAPGGFIYITTGLIDFVATEAELAAAIAHEIGRVQYSDPSFSEAKKQLDALTQGGLVIAPMFGPYGALAAVALYAADTLLMRRKSADTIMPLADANALAYMQQAGYDPQGLVDFLYKIQTAEAYQNKLMLNYLASHPLSRQRLKILDENFKAIAYDGLTYFNNAIEFSEVTAPVRALYRSSALR